MIILGVSIIPLGKCVNILSNSACTACPYQQLGSYKSLIAPWNCVNTLEMFDIISLLKGI